MANTARSINGIESTKCSTPPLNQLLNQITSIKLERGNFMLWKTLALLILRGYRLEGHLSDEQSLNPLYEAWVTADQLLLGWLYNSMAPEVAVQLMGFENAKSLWDAIHSLFGVQSRAEEVTSDGGSGQSKSSIHGASQGSVKFQQINSKPNYSNNGSGTRGKGRGRGNCPTCQVCSKYGHSTDVCYQRFNREFVPHTSQPKGPGQ
ncbi:uncharacterized protein LOC120067668 [Benincasa hispida]|uniref:uncharacterized protein LOC120067668 n=1 Tax=Benincasa hispida TaxID=102211 RepID=UPI001900B2E5|nr:uncharacterized protein LOC120067668 [Benincasa hispida]